MKLICIDMPRINPVTVLILVFAGLLFSIASVSGAHPLKVDTDGDGMPDGWEVEYGLNPTDAGDASVDYNDNGLTNLQEYKNDYDPVDRDTDDDGISNYAEFTGLFGFFTDPLVEDTDDDGLSDLREICGYIDTSNGTQMDELFPDETDRENARAKITSMRDEYRYKLDPTNPDTDYDGLCDGDEISRGANPTFVDSDGDGIYDGDEVYVYKTDPTSRDTDEDGLSDSEEIFGTYGFVTDPTNEDTDGDGVSDGEECLSFGLVPIAPSRYVLSYESFISGNEFANETITLKAQVDKIKYDRSQTNYSILLTSPETDLMQGGWGVVRVDNSWHYDLEHGMTHVDDRFGFYLRDGDTIVIIGKAGKIMGCIREIVVDSEGKLYLVLSPEEAKERLLPSREYVKLLSKVGTVTPSPSPTTTPTPTPEPSPIPNSTSSSLDENETEGNITTNATAPTPTTLGSMDKFKSGVIGMLGYGAIGIAIVIASVFLYTKFSKRRKSREEGKEEGGEVPLPEVTATQTDGTKKEWV